MNDQDPTPSPYDMKTALDRKVRRELAVRATDTLSEIFEVDVSLAALLDIAESDEPSAARTTAKRAIRAVTSISKEGSDVIERVGQNNVYHYVEAVVVYGASDKRYFELMDTLQLSAEAATGLYALREQIAEHTDGSLPSLPSIINALDSVGISIHQAAYDPDSALAAFEDAGYIFDHVIYQGDNGDKNVQYTRTIFFPAKGHTVNRLVDDDVDGSVTQGIREGLQESLRHPIEESDDEDENQRWHQDVIGDYLKNLES
jgi:hypothetical protein